jgi:hypothetical protein
MQRQPTDFNPANLADEFDPALVTMFEHENVGDEPAFDKLMTAYGQYVDIFSAYLYAKEEVLPFIRQQGLEAVTPEVLLNWLNQGHARIAKTLAHADQFQAGSFSTKQVTRWEWGGMIQETVARFIGGEDQHLNDIKEKALSCEVPAAKLKEMIAVLMKIRDLPKLKNIAKQARAMGDVVDAYKLGNTKLVLAYHNQYLTPKDMSTLKEIVVVCIPPTQYPAAMNEQDPMKRVRAGRAVGVSTDIPTLKSLLLFKVKNEGMDPGNLSDDLKDALNNKHKGWL